MISKETAQSIAIAYREIETAEKLLERVKETVDKTVIKDIRDVFGRATHSLQLGVPNGDSSQRLFDVPYTLAVPVIEAHIAHHHAILSALSEKAAIESGAIQP